RGAPRRWRRLLSAEGARARRGAYRSSPPASLRAHSGCAKQQDDDRARDPQGNAAAAVAASARAGAVMTARQHRLAIGAWIAVCLIWGTTYFAIRITLESLPPWLMSGFRWTAAGSIITLYQWSRGERLPPPSLWRGAAFLGFTLLVLGNGGVVWAEQYVPSGLAAVMVAASPFWMTGYEAFRPACGPLE